MSLEQILDKLMLAVRYRQNCELGFQDCDTLTKHITTLKDAISSQNSEFSKLKQEIMQLNTELAASKTVSTKKKGKK